MYNSDMPNRAELPSSGKLLRSTALAFTAAAALLVTTVLPADYGIDPTGIGAKLGLTEMGEIKIQLAEEAAADRMTTEAAAQNVKVSGEAGTTELKQLTERIGALESAVKLLIETSQKDSGVEKPKISSQVGFGQTHPMFVEIAFQAPKARLNKSFHLVQSTDNAADMPNKSDQITLTLKPGEGIEVKLVMKKDSQTSFKWTTEGGPVNFDIHADGQGQETISYEKGRGVETDDGVITAAFDGNHGWFWRNRGKQDVKLTLQTEGAYSEMKGVPPQ
jgi:hypothetical protein